MSWRMDEWVQKTDSGPAHWWLTETQLTSAKWLTVKSAVTLIHWLIKNKDPRDSGGGSLSWMNGWGRGPPSPCLQQKPNRPCGQNSSSVKWLPISTHGKRCQKLCHQAVFSSQLPSPFDIFRPLQRYWKEPGLGVRPGSEPGLEHFLAVWRWDSELTSPCFCSYLCNESNSTVLFPKGRFLLGNSQLWAGWYLWILSSNRSFLTLIIRRFWMHLLVIIPKERGNGGASQSGK